MKDKIQNFDSLLDIGVNFTHNLRFLMHKNNITAVNLAKCIGVSAELIGKLKNGSLNNPTLKVLAGLSKHFNVSIDDLAFKQIERASYHLQSKTPQYVPVVNWNNILNWKNTKPEKYLIMDKMTNDDIFALYLDYGCGPFLKGTNIFINPNLAPRNSDYVLIKNKITSDFYIKKLLIEEKYYLQSLISEINTILEYNENKYLIYGVIIGYQKCEFLRDE